MEEKPVRIFDYRGYTVPIYMDDYGQQFYCTLDGEEFGFGTYNNDYEEDLMYLIDQKLDVIHVFTDSEFYGAKLEYFFNGYMGYRDVRLSYRGRTLKVFLVKDKELTEAQTHNLVIESVTVLQNYFSQFGKEPRHEKD